MISKVKQNSFMVAGIAVLILGLAVLAWAADVFYPTNQGTLEWDAVTTMTNGLPVPATDAMAYNVFIKNEATAVETKANATDIVTPTYTITFANEGKYRVGIQAVRIIKTGGVETGRSVSAIAWSSDPLAVSAGQTFGFEFYTPPKAPINMRKP